MQCDASIQASSLSKVHHPLKPNVLFYGGGSSAGFDCEAPVQGTLLLGENEPFQKKRQPSRNG